MTGSLDLSAFPRFFEEIHDAPPFPWQIRLAKHVFDQGWPLALDVPTGAGKTSAIDVAVFHLACQIDPSAPARRTAAARILFVVDRRIVVDDVHRHAERIASAIHQSPRPITRHVAERLRVLAETNHRPLEVVRLRGGAPKEPDWVRTPTQPIVVVSTVDQVGSRLLFRGYGVSSSMWPVHAGLLGSDSLLLLDEAHLSQPFVQTVRAVREQQDAVARSSERVPAAPLQVCTLSATQVEQAPELLTGADREHPTLGPRLSASKPTTIELLSCKSDSAEHIDAIVEHVRALAAGGGTRAAAVVLNRVQRARRVFEALQKRMPNADIALLIGRSRPLERERVLEGILPRIRANRSRASDDQPREDPVIVVATQCVEVGADLDFDALVTEIAPLDSLRQRFGRLDRMGKSSPAARAVLVATPDQVGPRSAPDPVYGSASAATWRWLLEHASRTRRGKVKALEIDFGIAASDAWLPAQPSELSPLLAPRTDAPAMNREFIDRWARTSPRPIDEPDVSLFLHGPESTGDVQIIWRADLERPARSFWSEQAAACPPSSWEAVAVPVWEARRWLQGLQLHPQLDDLAASPEPSTERSRRRGHRVLRWRGSAENSDLIYATDIRTGDVLVVPTSDGGCDRWGWNPASGQEVADLGSEASRKHRGVDVLRLSPRLLERDLLRELGGPTARRDASAQESPGSGQDAERRARTAALRLEGCLSELVDATESEAIERLRELPDLPEEWRRILSAEGRQPRVFRVENGSANRDSVPIGIPLAVVHRLDRYTSEATTEDDESSRRSPRRVNLTDHSKGVSALARFSAEKCGLPEHLVEDIALAGFLHDSGKAHRAFKLWLYGGDELAASGPPLAKSGRQFLPSRARGLAALPRNARHEVASIAFAEAHPRLREAHDSGLVLWLVGTHHGWGRPFFPGIEWPPAGDSFSADLGDGTIQATVRPLAELSARWVALGDTLTRRYGVWGLARLEAILRLADHRRSQQEQENERPSQGDSKA